MLWRRVCGLMSVLARCGSLVLAWYLLMIQAMPPRLSLVWCWLKNTGWSSWPGVFGEEAGQERCRVVHQGDVAGLAAFAGQGGHGGGFESDVADGEVCEFLDSGCGVVAGGEQGRVAAALAGGPVGRGE